MARYDAIGAVTAALGGLLETAAAAEEETMSVIAFTPAALVASLQPGTRTLGLWLYAVSPNAQRRAIHRPQVDGQRRRLPGTAVDLHYLLIARAADALVQQKLLGWGIRELEDHASLPPAVLNNGAFDGCFRDDETVELTLEPLTPAEENDIWQVAQTARLPAAPYAARMVVLDSRRTLPDAAAVTERDVEVVS
jgi:hypothetical protein